MDQPRRSARLQAMRSSQRGAPAFMMVFERVLCELIRGDYTHYDVVVNGYRLNKTTYRMYRRLAVTHAHVFNMLKMYERRDYILRSHRRCSEDLYRALSRDGLVIAAWGRTWYATHLSGEWLLAALRDSGLLNADVDREWYRKAFLERQHPDTESLLDALDEAGLLTADVGRNWLRDAFAPDLESLHEALQKAGLLTAPHPLTFATFVDELEWFVDVPKLVDSNTLDRVTLNNWLFRCCQDSQLLSSHFFDKRLCATLYTGIHVLHALRAANLLTPDLGRNWCVQKIKCIETRHAVMSEAGLIVDVTASWCVRVFGQENSLSYAYAAIKTSGAPSLGRAWCMRVFRRDPIHLYKVLKLWDLIEFEDEAPSSGWLSDSDDSDDA